MYTIHVFIHFCTFFVRLCTFFALKSFGTEIFNRLGNLYGVTDVYSTPSLRCCVNNCLCKQKPFCSPKHIHSWYVLCRQTRIFKQQHILVKHCFNIQADENFPQKLHECRKRTLHTTGMAQIFDPRTKFATAWPLEARVQCDLRNLRKNRLLKCIVVQ